MKKDRLLKFMRLFMFSHPRSLVVYSLVRLFTRLSPRELLSQNCFMDYFGPMCRISLHFFGVHRRQLVPDAAEQFVVARPELLALYQ